MNVEDSYAREVSRYYEEAKALEAAWVDKSSANKKAAEEYASTDFGGCNYRSMPWKPSSRFGRKGCMRCKESQLEVSGGLFTLVVACSLSSPFDAGTCYALVSES